MKRLLVGFIGCMIAWAGMSGAAEVHVTTAQELQTALTLAASNGEADTVYLAAGYYTGVVTFNSAEALALTVRAEEGVAGHEVTLDGGGLGSALTLTATAAANLTVQGLTFSRHCGNAGKGALALSTSTSGSVLVDRCQFIGANGASGMGVGIGSAQSATVRDCTATRDASSSGDGIYISGVTGTVLVERNAVKGGGTGVNYWGRGITVINAAATQTTLRDNTVSRCQTYTTGGGVWLGVGSGTATLTGNTVSENYVHSSGAMGGGVYIEISSGTATLAANTLRANSGGYRPQGGGLYAKIAGGGSLNLTGNTITGNGVSSGDGSAYCEGGGIYFQGTHTSSGVYVYPTFTMTGNTVSGNTAGSSSINTYPKGGGVYLYFSQYAVPTAVLENNTISGNRCYGPGSIVPMGGGLYAQGSVTALTLLRNTITGNEGEAGGGVYATCKTLKLLSNVFANNKQIRAGYAGGGVCAYVTTLFDLVNNTVTANTAQTGGGVYCSGDTAMNVYNNIIWGNTAAGDGDDVYVTGAAASKIFRSNCAHDLYGIWHISENNIDAAPLFYDAATNDYHLTVGSPCLNAGTNDAPSIPAVDFEGEARIVSTTVDIGADEMPAATDTHPADLDSDWVISEAEYAGYAAAWKTNGAWTPPPSPVSADFATRAGYLRQQAAGSYQNEGGKKPICWVPN